MIVTVLHELTHAVVAYTRGVRSTLFNYFVDLDLTLNAATSIPALIGVTGPSFCRVDGGLRTGLMLPQPPAPRQSNASYRPFGLRTMPRRRLEASPFRWHMSTLRILWRGCLHRCLSTSDPSRYRIVDPQKIVTSAG